MTDRTRDRMPEPMNGPASERRQGVGGWRPGTGVAVPLVVGVALLGVGILAGRASIAALALPVLLGIAWCWETRPGRAGTLSVSAEDRGRTDGRVRVRLDWRPAAGVEQLRLSAAARGHLPRMVVLAPPSTGIRTVTLGMRTVRTGRRPTFAVTAVETAGQQVAVGAAIRSGPIPVTVLPRSRSLGELPLPPRPQGLTSRHDSRRVGDGGDLRDVSRFVPGDRLRRIDWRATARHARPGAAGVGGGITELYVRRSFATADATVMLVLDSRDEIGPDVGSWGDSSRLREDRLTSLDRARNAAASFARRSIESGDRVGLEDLGRVRRPVAPAAGRRHLQRLVRRIALAEPEGEPTPRRRVPRLPAAALIVVFSTYLDDEPVWLAQNWRRAGHRVLAVDVLPDLETGGLDAKTAAAYRLVMMERADRLDDLRRSAVELVRWTDDADSGTRADAAPDQDTVPAGLAALARHRVRR